MEKYIKSFILTLLTMFLYSACIARSPESILRQQFNISLSGFDYDVETFEEQWAPNGDGYVYIVFKFNILTESNVEYFLKSGLKKLPMSEKEKIPDRFLFENGYYIFEAEDPNDVRDYKLFIVDTDNNNATLYFQYM